MDVTPVDPYTATAPGGAAPSARNPPSPRDVQFDTSLARAMASRPGHETIRTPVTSTRPLTLGQMLHMYALPPGTRTGPGSVAPAPHAPAGPAGPTTARGTAASLPSDAHTGLGIGPVVRPLPGAVGSAWGSRVHPVHGDVRMHHGSDIGAPTGTPIQAFASGRVTFAGHRGGYGNLVILEHANGITSRYAHQSTMDVVVGQHVAAGELVGRVGATGTATGPHLHFELRRDGASFDPAPHLP